MGYQPIGANYKPSQSNLVWTGTGWGRAQPGGIRQSDLRRFMRSPEGVRFQLNQQAETTRTERQDQRSDAKDKAVTAAQQQAQQQAKLDKEAEDAAAQKQAKLDKEAEDAAADARFNSMLDALSSDKSILSPNQRATLAKIKGVKERQSALEVFMRANETEAEQAAQKAEKAAAAQYTYEDVPGAPYLVVKDGTGKVIQTLTKDKPDAKPVTVPEGMVPASMDSTGRVTYKPAPTSNAAPKVQTLKIAGIDQSVIWNGTSFVPVQVGAAPSAAAPTSAAPAATAGRSTKTGNSWTVKQ